MNCLKTRMFILPLPCLMIENNFIDEAPVNEWIIQRFIDQRFFLLKRVNVQPKHECSCRNHATFALNTQRWGQKRSFHLRFELTWLQPADIKHVRRPAGLPELTSHWIRADPDAILLIQIRMRSRFKAEWSQKKHLSVFQLKLLLSDPGLNVFIHSWTLIHAAQFIIQSRVDLLEIDLASCLCLHLKKNMNKTRRK